MSRSLVTMVRISVDDASEGVVNLPDPGPAYEALGVVSIQPCCGGWVAFQGWRKKGDAESKPPKRRQEGKTAAESMGIGGGKGKGGAATPPASKLEHGWGGPD